MFINLYVFLQKREVWYFMLLNAQTDVNRRRINSNLSHMKVLLFFCVMHYTDYYVVIKD